MLLAIVYRQRHHEVGDRAPGSQPALWCMISANCPACLPRVSSRCCNAGDCAAKEKPGADERRALKATFETGKRRGVGWEPASETGFDQFSAFDYLSFGAVL